MRQKKRNFSKEVNVARVYNRTRTLTENISQVQPDAQSRFLRPSEPPKQKYSGAGYYLASSGAPSVDLDLAKTEFLMATGIQYRTPTEKRRC